MEQFPDGLIGYLCTVRKPMLEVNDTLTLHSFSETLALSV